MNIKIKVYVIYLFHWIVENACLNTVSLKNACLIWLVTLFFGVVQELAGKETQDKKVVVNPPSEQDDVSLFYSDIMPLLVRKTSTLILIIFV